MNHHLNIFSMSLWYHPANDKQQRQTLPPSLSLSLYFFVLIMQILFVWVPYSVGMLDSLHFFAALYHTFLSSYRDSSARAHITSEHILQLIVPEIMISSLSPYKFSFSLRFISLYTFPHFLSFSFLSFFFSFLDSEHYQGLWKEAMLQWTLQRVFRAMTLLHFILFLSIKNGRYVFIHRTINIHSICILFIVIPLLTFPNGQSIVDISFFFLYFFLYSKQCPNEN